MKKISLVLIMLVGFTSAVLADEWVNFNDRGVTAPIYEVTNSTSSLVEFELEIPGMNSKDIDNFNRVYVPEHTTMDSVGFPEIPVVSFLVAIPECDNVNLNVTLLDSIVIDNMNIYPSPELVEVQNGDITYLEEQFSINDAAYNTDEYFPGYTGKLVEKGAVRAQHCIRILIYPVQFNPVNQKVIAYSRVNIEMTFDGVSGSINENVGIFNEVCGHSMINYNSNGLNASVSCGVGKDNPGTWQWVEDFPGEYINENCDYLIITHENFYDNPVARAYIDSLSRKRAEYNGFDVVMVKMVDINEEIGGIYNYERIRNLIKNTYENGYAEHTYDNKIGYVNLFGDAYFGSVPDSICVPTYSSGYDVYFSQLTIGLDGEPDVYPDILLGRCSVDSEEQVANVCQKIVDYEPIDVNDPEYNGWKDRMTFLLGTPLYDIYSSLQDISSMISASETNLLVNPNDIPMAQNLGYDNVEENFYDNLLNRYAAGNQIITYYGHGGTTYWLTTGFSFGDLNEDIFEHKLPFIYSMACLTGAFHSNDNCMAERFLCLNSIKGSIGFIGASVETLGLGSVMSSVNFFTASYEKGLGSCGELLLEFKLNATNNKLRNDYNLFGDPALNILLDSDNINECDLICNAQEIDFDNTQNQNLNITAGINNLSQVEVNDDFTVDCTLTNVFLNMSETESVTLNGIAPMGEISAIFNFDVSNYVPGDYEVKIIVDVFDDIDERNDENNTTTITHEFERPQDGFPVLYSHSQDYIPNVPLVDNGCVIIGNKKLSSNGNQIWENDLETYGLPLPLYDNDTDETDYIFLNSDRNQFFKVNGTIGNYVEIYSDPGNIYNYCLGDVNNDGELELICNAQYDDSPITDQRLIIIDLSNNNNLFYVGIDDCDLVNDIAIGDGNNDGKNEIYVLDATNDQLKRYEFNNNEITLTDYKQFDCTPSKIVLEDFNMDGDLDCFIVTYGFRLYLLDCSTWGFDIICEMQQPNRELRAVSAGDIYNDGITKIVEIEKMHDEPLEIYLISINDNEFSRELLFRIEDSFDGIIPYDLNSNNQLDLLLYRYDTISGYTNSGDKLFQISKCIGAPVICDIDNDSDVELIFEQNVSNYDNKRKLIVSDLTINTSNHGNIYPKMNKYNNNLYCQPVTGSLSEETTYHWNGSFTLHNDVILPENSILYIMPGSVIKAQNRSNLSILGILTAKGAENQPIKFTPNIQGASCNYWQGIEITSSGNASFANCTIENAEGVYLYNNNEAVTINNMTIENCFIYNESYYLNINNSEFINSNINQHGGEVLIISHVDFNNSCVTCNWQGRKSNVPMCPGINISNCTFINSDDYAVSITGYDRYRLCDNDITECGGGFYIYESGIPKNDMISNNTIGHNNGSGIMLYHSYAKILHHNSITENLRGIFAVRSSSMRIVGDEEPPYSLIQDNDYVEITFDGDSYPEEISYNKIIDDVFDEGTPDQYLMMFLEFVPVPPFELKAENNYWGAESETWEEGDGDYRFYPGDSFDYLPVWIPGNPKFPNSSLPEQLYADADSLIQIEEYETAKQVYKNIINQYPESKYSIFSMRNLLPLETVSGQDFASLQEYYITNPNCNYNDERIKLSAYLANYCSIKLENYPSVINFFEDIIEDPDTELDSIYAVIDAGYTYLLMEDGGVKSTYVGRMSELKPKSLEEFEATRDSLLAKLLGLPDTDEDETIIENIFYLGHNYPNPLSSSTTISFTLPLYTQKAELKIYNIKGQLVRELDINTKTVIGSISWDGLDSYGKKVGSGIYFYKLTADKKEIVKKMVLMR